MSINAIIGTTRLTTASRSQLQRLPHKVFTSADFGKEEGKKLRAYYTTGTGVTRRTIVLVDLEGFGSFEFSAGTFELTNLPAGERDGFFMLLPINYQLGVEYAMGFSNFCFGDINNSNIQFLLTPIGSLSSTNGNNTAVQGIGFDTDAGATIAMSNVVNYQQLQGGVAGIPLYSVGNGASPITPSRGWWDNNLSFYTSRCIRGVSWTIEKTGDGGFDGAGYTTIIGPCVYGDFN